MLKLIFIAVYWSAFFFLRRFFENYGLEINDRIYNLAGAAIFVSIVAAYAFLSTFFRAYLGVGKARSANRRIDEPEKTTATETERTDRPSKKDNAPAPPKNKSRVKVLRGIQDE